MSDSVTEFFSNKEKTNVKLNETDFNKNQLLDAAILGSSSDLILLIDGKEKDVRVIAAKKVQGMYYVAYAPIEDGIADPGKINLTIVDNAEVQKTCQLSEQNLPLSFNDLISKLKEGINSKDLEYKERYLWTNRVIFGGAVLSWISRHLLAFANSTGIPELEFVRQNFQFFYPVVQWDKVSDFGVFSFLNLRLPSKDQKIISGPKDFLTSGYGLMLLYYGVFYEIIWNQLPNMVEMMKNGNPYGLGLFDPFDILTEAAGAITTNASTNEFIKRIQNERIVTINENLRERVLKHTEDKQGLNVLFEKQRNFQNEKENDGLLPNLITQMKELVAITEGGLSDIEKSLGNNKEARELLKQFARTYTFYFVRQFCFSQTEVENKEWAWKMLYKKDRSRQILNKYRIKV